MCPGAWWSPGICGAQTHVPMRRVPARLGSFLGGRREAGPHGEALEVAALLYSKGGILCQAQVVCGFRVPLYPSFTISPQVVSEMC